MLWLDATGAVVELLRKTNLPFSGGTGLDLDQTWCMRACELLQLQGLLVMVNVRSLDQIHLHRNAAQNLQCLILLHFMPFINPGLHKGYLLTVNLVDLQWRQAGSHVIVGKTSGVPMMHAGIN